MNTPNHYGLIIKQLIKRKGYDIQDAAKRIGVSRSYLQTVFNKKDISTGFARKVAKGLNVNVETILCQSASSGPIESQTIANEPIATYQLERDKLEIEYLKRENDLLRELLKKP